MGIITHARVRTCNLLVQSASCRNLLYAFCFLPCTGLPACLSVCLRVQTAHVDVWMDGRLASRRVVHRASCMTDAAVA